LRREIGREIHWLEGLVAHRELQLLRAGATCDRRYVNRRQEKLDLALGWLARKRAELEAAA
jgi:hypothetical protein